MKNKFLILITFTLLFSLPSFGQNTSLQDFAEDPAMEVITFLTGDAKQDSVTGNITFHNIGILTMPERIDNNTYIINKSTYIDQVLKDYSIINFEKLISGEWPYISVYILKKDLYVNQELIQVQAVSALSQKVVGDSSSRRNVFDRLEKFSIMTKDEQGSFRPSEFITRAELAKVLVTAYGMPLQIKASVFIDVLPSHWAYHYINTIQEMKMMQGHGNNCFAPDQMVTYSEAIKSILCLLGYEPLAVQKGGYPEGYIQVGHDTNLINMRTYLKKEELVSREVIANLMDDALDMPLMKKVRYGEQTEYAIFDGKDFPLETLSITMLQEK